MDSSIFLVTDGFGRMEILVCLMQFPWGLKTDNVSSPM